MLKKALSMALVFMLMLPALFACGSKTPLTKEEFIDLVENEGYIILNEKTNRFEDGVAAAIQASDPGGDFAVEFYIFSSIDNAKDASGKIYKDLNTKSGTQVSNSVTGYFRLTSKGMFYFLSRAEDTLVYVETDEKNKDAASEMLKTLGYW